MGPWKFLHNGWGATEYKRLGTTALDQGSYRSYKVCPSSNKQNLILARKTNGLIVHSTCTENKAYSINRFVLL